MGNLMNASNMGTINPITKMERFGKRVTTSEAPKPGIGFPITTMDK